MTAHAINDRRAVAIARDPMPLDAWRAAALALLAVRLIEGFIYWGGGSRRFIYAPSKLDPHATSWMANRFQLAMPGALLGTDHVVAYLLQHLWLRYPAVILFSAAEFLAGLMLMAGLMTRGAALVSVGFPVVLMLLFGWQGPPASTSGRWRRATSPWARPRCWREAAPTRSTTSCSPRPHPRGPQLSPLAWRRACPAHGRDGLPQRGADGAGRHRGVRRRDLQPLARIGLRRLPRRPGEPRQAPHVAERRDVVARSRHTGPRLPRRRHPGRGSHIVDPRCSAPMEASSSIGIPRHRAVCPRARSATTSPTTRSRPVLTASSRRSVPPRPSRSPASGEAVNATTLRLTTVSGNSYEAGVARS